MKYSRFFKRTSEDFFRDFSGLGNPLLIITTFSLVLAKDKLKTAIIGLFAVMLVCYAIKLFFNKERPDQISHSNLLELIQSRSFPSVHSAMAMYLGIVVIKNTTSIIADSLFAITILIVGYSRHYLKKHFAIDIIWGYAIGFLVYFLLF